MAEYNYGLLTNMASGIREGMNTYMTLKHQQRQESMLEQQMKNQEQDRQMKMLQAGITQDEGGGLMLSPEMEEKRKYDVRASEQKAIEADRAVREQDPGSQESQAMRGLIAQQTGRPVPNNISAAQLKSSMGFLGGIHRADEAGASKAAVAQNKADEKELRLAVPGYERTGEVLTKEEEAMKLRKATANADQLRTKLKRLRELVGGVDGKSGHGSFEWGGQAGTEMESLATEIQLLAKGEDMYQLGVLAGPDLTLLNKITADPSSLSSLFTKDSTRLKQIDSQLKSIDQKLESVTKASGYRPAGKDSAPDLKTVNGKQYKKVPGGWEEVPTVGAR